MRYQIKPICGFPGYFADSDGKVWSKVWPRSRARTELATEMRELRSQKHYGTGYRFVMLARKGKKCKRYVHSLVLEAFVGRCPADKNETRHLNGVRGDNRLENLVWGTYLENYDDKVRHGTSPLGKSNPKIQGQKHGRAKLTDQQAREIYDARGKESYRSLSKRFGISVDTIYNIWNKRQWKCIHSTGDTK